MKKKSELKEVSEKYDVDIISLIAPTSHGRIRTIAAEARGFLYVVSSMGVTGVRSKIETDIGAMVKLVRESSDIPCAIGFGIATPEQARAMASVSDGAIVGSAIVELIARHGRDSIACVADYVKSMKAAVMEA